MPVRRHHLKPAPASRVETVMPDFLWNTDRRARNGPARPDSPLATTGVLLLALAALGSCSTGLDLRGLDAEAMFDRGETELAEGNWGNAVTVFERFTFEFPRHPLAERARFNLGRAFFGREEYLTASTEFLRVVQDYPNGEYADDARFMVCRAYEELSPQIPLDQEYTRGAVEHCSALADYYPGSVYADSARITGERLRDKLAAKELYRADFYYRVKAYDSAIVYLEELLASYPRSGVAPQALLRLVQIYEVLGYDDELEDARRRLLQEFPDSPEAARVRTEGDDSLVAG
jgi:outer membrane protein assembly factor BamD